MDIALKTRFRFLVWFMSSDDRCSECRDEVTLQMGAAVVV